jgi:phage shock protein A
MGVFKSIRRFIFTLGGLLASRVDEETDALVSTPAGVKAAFRQTRDRWTKQYHEVRDAISQLMMVMEQKKAEIKRLEAEDKDLEIKKRGSVEKFRETRDERFQKAFQDYHTREQEVEKRLEELSRETVELDQQLERYKIKLTEMQKQIANLDRQEAEAIADIVSSKQIVALNDRMANLATELHDENIQAVERVRQKAKAKAKLSEELAGTNHADIEKQIVAAGMNSEINEEFARMLAETELKAKERPGAQRAEADRMM